VGQTNNVMRFFNKLDLTVKLRLFLSYCSSVGLYGSELWSLDGDNIAIVCTARRKALLFLVLFGQFRGTVLVTGSTIHLLTLTHCNVVIALTGHMIC
jgi:hypothetical protein